MSFNSKEGIILLALQAPEKDLKLKVKKAAEIYNVNRITLTRRHAS